MSVKTVALVVALWICTLTQQLNWQRGFTDGSGIDHWVGDYVFQGHVDRLLADTPHGLLYVFDLSNGSVTSLRQDDLSLIETRPVQAVSRLVMGGNGEHAYVTSGFRLREVPLSNVPGTTAERDLSDLSDIFDSAPEILLWNGATKRIYALGLAQSRGLVLTVDPSDGAILSQRELGLSIPEAQFRFPVDAALSKDGQTLYVLTYRKEESSVLVFDESTGAFAYAIAGSGDEKCLALDDAHNRLAMIGRVRGRLIDLSASIEARGSAFNGGLLDVPSAGMPPFGYGSGSCVAAVDTQTGEMAAIFRPEGRAVLLNPTGRPGASLPGTGWTDVLINSACGRMFLAGGPSGRLALYARHVPGETRPTCGP